MNAILYIHGLRMFLPCAGVLSARSMCKEQDMGDCMGVDKERIFQEHWQMDDTRSVGDDNIAPNLGIECARLRYKIFLHSFNEELCTHPPSFDCP